MSDSLNYPGTLEDRGLDGIDAGGTDKPVGRSRSRCASRSRRIVACPKDFRSFCMLRWNHAWSMVLVAQRWNLLTSNGFDPASVQRIYSQQD